MIANFYRVSSPACLERALNFFESAIVEAKVFQGFDSGLDDHD